MSERERKDRERDISIQKSLTKYGIQKSVIGKFKNMTYEIIFFIKKKD